MSDRKVLILQTAIMHYRIPVFNLIGQHPGVKLTVAYEKGMEARNGKLHLEGLDFNVVSYENKRVLGSLKKIKHLRRLVSGYDVVIFPGDLHLILPIISLLLQRKRRRIYFWGIGLSSENSLRESFLKDKIRFLLTDLSDGTILYSSHVAEIYRKKVLKPGKVFVAHNSIRVKKFPLSEEKRTKVLSIGTFKKNKRLSDLVIAFGNIIDRIPENITLDFIGDGEEGAILQQLVEQNGLSGRVNFWGRIEDDEKIYAIIRNAIVSVSPTQAGLSVLHAMALGCPFLTSVNAITGGEKFNIKENYTGYYYNGQVSDLEQKLLNIIRDEKTNQQIAHNAYDFYHKERSIEQMAQSFIDLVIK
ncbi:Glycosyltransferase involved in cell wall bisynthesis [Chitinophaga rupis]|uniref:Glycosyltransferase involved in cell wall bisynthesis n=1 Tax=Chitinophaga rupis TaxID=573321 RepID=A0A1H7QKD8_9BACT|nr:glycosyltransferase family 4 protein [Chitinophaga rupis]SEL48590.1 Glycosyltransferase involved in cell wall bisynthesis [Chitinophaga rupis]